MSFLRSYSDSFWVCMAFVQTYGFSFGNMAQATSEISEVREGWFKNPMGLVCAAGLCGEGAAQHAFARSPLHREVPWG